MGESLVKYYIDLLSEENIPGFLHKYLETPSLKRLQKVGYFCGMDYASKDIYDFSEYISRYDHSLTVALITYRLTHDKKATLAGLFHDIATPCFSHVIDYMNKDYENQESTEEFTEHILKNDNYLIKCIEEDYLSIEDIVNFKKYSIVDNDRPKVCADRIDGVILTGIGWTKNISKSDIKNIIEDMGIFINEFGEEEIGFTNESVAKRVTGISESIDAFCHSNEDNYMMELLASITRLSIKKGYLKYEELYSLTEDEIFRRFIEIDDEELNELLITFSSIKKDQIPIIQLPKVKIRELKPLVNKNRINN